MQQQNFFIEKIDNHREALSKRNKNKTSAGERSQIMTKTQHNHRESLSKRYVLSYIRFGFQGDGTGRGGDLPLYHKQQYPLLPFIPYTIVHLTQKNCLLQKNFIYLRLVLQTLSCFEQHKKIAF